MDSTVVANRGFKALKQSVKLHFRSKNQQEMMDTYTSMLKYIKSAVTRNDSEKVKIIEGRASRAAAHLSILSGNSLDPGGDFNVVKYGHAASLLRDNVDGLTRSEE